MSSARFWYLPLKDVAPEDQRADLAARDEVRASDLPASYGVPSKLFQEGIRTGHVLALHDGDKVVALARLLALDGADSLHWRRLPMLTAAEPVATPELSVVEPHEAAKFTIGIDALLRDVPASTVATASPEIYSAAGPASNIILYGPPGTGKTYSVRRRALELLGYPTAATATDAEVKAEWDRLLHAGQIVFCTFHQAFAYEEFVEGLRAETDEEGNVHYRVMPGVFKRLAMLAAKEIAALGAGAAEDFATLWAILIAELRTQPKTVSGKQGGTYILEASSRDNVTVFNTIKNAAGAFEKDQNAATQSASRAVMESVWNDRDVLGDSPSVSDLKRYQTGGSQLWVVYMELRRLSTGTKSRDPRHFVLVIDEINRANIARVFGELITLLEPDKRLGERNELRVQLPASKDWFGVPPNLHVLGTMNTADRSIALMDVALRRRFTFEELMPDVGAIEAALNNAGVDASLRELATRVFTRLNQRLRYLYDREHQIGHAYFLEIKSLADLRTVFAERIMPLLQEYFFGQWDKLALVLGHPHGSDGAPRERYESSSQGTFLTARKVAEVDVLGIDHDEYGDRIAWDIHPAFRPRGAAPDDAWLVQAFEELAGQK